MTADPGKPRKPMGRPRDPHMEDRVITAAIHVLARNGMTGFSTDHVATRAAASKASIYRRWSTTDQLLCDVTRTLGPRDGDIAWPARGTVRGDLVALLTATTTGVRARAELALLSALPYRPALREAWAAGPLARFAAAVDVLHSRARDRGDDSATMPRPVRVQAAHLWLRVDAAQRGEDPAPDVIAGIVDVLLLPHPAVADAAQEPQWAEDQL